MPSSSRPFLCYTLWRSGSLVPKRRSLGTRLEKWYFGYVWPHTAHQGVECLWCQVYNSSYTPQSGAAWTRWVKTVPSGSILDVTHNNSATTSVIPSTQSTCCSSSKVWLLSNIQQCTAQHGAQCTGHRWEGVFLICCNFSLQCIINFSTVHQASNECNASTDRGFTWK